MSNGTRSKIYFAQVENVRSVETAIRTVRRSIHTGLRTGDGTHVEVQTKLLAQVFCAWAEVNFMKVVYTPHGFSVDEIEQVKNAWQKNGLTDGWRKATFIGLGKVQAKKTNFVPNAQQTIVRAIEKYVLEPSQIRNKIAHGQWKCALNRENSSINMELTNSINSISIIDIDKWYEGHRKLAAIVESLIESPEKTFARDYWPQLTSLNEFERLSRQWTIEARTDLLKKKYSRRPT